MSDSIQVTVPVRFIQSIVKLSSVASSDMTRGYLCSVYWNDERKELVATDGHALTTHPFSEVTIGQNLMFSIYEKFEKEHLKLLKTFLKQRKSHFDVELIINDKTIMIDLGQGMTVTFNRGTREFPKYEACIPSNPTFKAEVSFDIEILKRAVDSLYFAEKKHEGKITLKIINELSPVFISQTLSNKDASTCIIMPIKA